MNKMKTIKSTLFVIGGACLILLFAGQLLLQLIFLLIGLYLINLGLTMRGIQPSSYIMRFGMRKF